MTNYHKNQCNSTSCTTIKKHNTKNNKPQITVQTTVKTAVKPAIKLIKRHLKISKKPPQDINKPAKKHQKTNHTTTPKEATFQKNLKPLKPFSKTINKPQTIPMRPPSKTQSFDVYPKPSHKTHQISPQNTVRTAKKPFKTQ